MWESQAVKLLIQSAPLLLRGALMTIKISLCAVIIGVIFGTLIGTTNCRRLRPPFLGWFLDMYIAVIRGTPIFIQVLIVLFVIPDLLNINLSPFAAGVLALGVNSTAYVGEIVRTGINSIPHGQWEAAHVLGYQPSDTLRFIILPQMLRNVLPALTNELVVLIKETSILSTIGLVELTRISRNIIARELDPVTIYLAAAVLYLVMTTTVSLIAQRLERSLTYD